MDLFRLIYGFWKCIQRIFLICRLILVNILFLIFFLLYGFWKFCSTNYPNLRYHSVQMCLFCKLRIFAGMQGFARFANFRCFISISNVFFLGFRYYSFSFGGDVCYVYFWFRQFIFVKLLFFYFLHWFFNNLLYQFSQFTLFYTVIALLPPILHFCENVERHAHGSIMVFFIRICNVFLQDVFV